MPQSRVDAGRQSIHPHLRPYLFHGLDLAVGGTHATADCPFCGREGKFSVQLDTGLWRCLVCAAGTAAGGGNGLVFARLLYERAYAPGTPTAAGAAAGGAAGRYAAFAAAVAADRGLGGPGAVRAWGLAPTADGAWLVPGYGADGRLDQVYRRTRVPDGHGGHGGHDWRLLPTPGIWPEGRGHALHLPAGDFDPSRPQVDVCEGPWDGMALWECREALGDTNIVAVPGCGVWRDEWTELCRGKRVRLWYDSDHPKAMCRACGKSYSLVDHPTCPVHGTPPDGMTVAPAGREAARRVAGRLSGAAASVGWLRWGPDGYDPRAKSGWDVRDELVSAPQGGRLEVVAALLDQVEVAPREWFLASSPLSAAGHPRHENSVEALPCSTWAECLEAWRGAIRMRRDLEDALAVMLAVCASTSQAGNQLFMDLIGSPGSAKTTLAQGLLTSGHCVHLEHATKLISGYKKPGDGDKDCSFLARANNKTWVTCEFDVLGSSPEYHQLMGKVRRIFDGETSATYGNDDKDRVYTALRTPWIRAGTPRMMDRMADYDQSQLGDRFMRFIIGDPEDGERREIAKSALKSERLAMVGRANCSTGSVVDPKTRLAHALTGGYVDWLRASVEDLLAATQVSDSAEERCLDLAELCAEMRARPNEDRRKLDVHDTKEMPTRLARQYARLASHLAVVLNRPSVDAEVLRVVRKVALDTAAGHTLNVVRWLCSPNFDGSGRLYQDSGGLMAATLESWTGMTAERLGRYLGFLCKIGVLRMARHERMGNSWALTERVFDLYLRVMEG